MDEKRIARIYYARGFKFAVQFKRQGELFGDPLYFENDIKYTEFTKTEQDLEVVWKKPIREMI